MNLNYALYVIQESADDDAELAQAARLVAAEYSSLVAAIEGLKALEKRP